MLLKTGKNDFDIWARQLSESTPVPLLPQLAQQPGAGPAPVPHSAALCPHSHRRQMLREKPSTSIQLQGEKARGCVLLLCSRDDSRAWNISVSPCVYTTRVPAGDKMLFIRQGFEACCPLPLAFAVATYLLGSAGH